MSRIVFDFSGAMAQAVGEKGFSKEELSGADGGMRRAHKQLAEKSPGFTRLPKGQENILEDIIKTGAEIREKFENFVVLGIGGSALGPIAVHTALSHEEDKGINFFVEDNIDPERMARLLELDMEKTMFNVISKSGKTSETMAQLMAVVAALEKKGLPLSRHIIATTDAENGNLVQIARKEGLKTFVIPGDVGGRFSELTPVGLIAAAVCGYDIRAMLEGAAQMNEACKAEQNPAAVYALLHVLGMWRGMNVSVMMPYADGLKYIADWYAQLWAESLGKRRTLDGREVYAGQTPVKALGVTDQHSQIQLYTEGPFDKIVTFLEVENFQSDPEISPVLGYVEDLSFLGGKTFGQLLSAELRATEHALKKAGRPNIKITLEEVNEFTIGALLQFFEIATAYAAEMLGINAFDQPGVEEGKKATFALMGKKGFEDKRAEIEGAGAKATEWIFEV